MRVLLALVLLLIGCVPALESVPIGPIEQSNLEQAGLDSRYWQAMLNQIKTQNLPIDAVALALGNQMLAQDYFGGYAPNIPHDLRSTTKSITSLLIGIALDKGLFRLDTPIGDFFPEYPSTAASKVTVRNLLSMQSGLECNDWQASRGNEEGMYLSSDWIKFFFDIPRTGNPGQNFSYCTAGVVVLGEVVARASKEPLPVFAQKYLFEPLGVLEARYAQAPKGVTDAGGHLRLTPQSLLKIGMLVRDGGVWQGQRVVSQGWIQTMLEPRSTPYPDLPQLRYGYLWLMSMHEGKVSSYQAWGNGGQYIFVIPETGLVVGFTGHAYSDPTDLAAFNLMSRYLIPMAARVPFTQAP